MAGKMGIRKIRRRCARGCGGITNYGKMYINGHQNRGAHWQEHPGSIKAPLCICGCGNKVEWNNPLNRWNIWIDGHNGRKHYPIKRIRRRCACGCGEITNYGSIWIRGHNPSDNLTKLGQKLSEEVKFNMSLGQLKRRYNPNSLYCAIWADRSYKRDIRKDYCENVDCNNTYERIGLHHIHLDKKRCAPNDLMTLCNPCHSILHKKLQRGKNKAAVPLKIAEKIRAIAKKQGVSVSALIRGIILKYLELNPHL